MRREKKEFNFAQRWERQLIQSSQRPRGSYRNFIVWGVSGVLFAGALAGSPWIWEYKRKMDLNQVNTNIASLKEVDAMRQKLDGLKKQIQNQKQLGDQLQKNNHDPGPVMDKIRVLLPAGTTIQSFNMQADSLTLGLTLQSPIDVARLWTSLNDSKLFQNVDIQTVSLQDKAQTLTLNLKFR